MHLSLRRNSIFCDNTKTPPRVSQTPNNYSPIMVFSANNSILSIAKTPPPTLLIL
jgi:hypothetical protein